MNERENAPLWLRLLLIAIYVSTLAIAVMHK